MKDVRFLLFAQAVLAVCAACAGTREVRLCAGECAAVSPDGGSVAFMRLADHRFGVVVRNIRSGEETVVPSGPGQAIEPRWRHDGALVFTAANETKSAFEARKDSTGWNLFLFRDGQVERLTSGRIRETCASYAPDGSLWFVADATGKKDAPCIVRLTSDGRRETAVTLPSDVCLFGDPSVSPDGTRLLRAEAAQYNQPWRIIVSPVGDTNARTYLTPKTMAAYAPAWSPDGETIAFTGCQEGDDGWQVYLMPAAGGPMSRIAKGKNPCFAPNGKTLVYDRDGEIFVTKLNEGED